MILLVSVLLLFLQTEQGSTEPQVSGTELEPGSSVADTCQSVKDEAQAIRREGYDAIDKAYLIRDQAYRVKDEAFELKDEAYEIKVNTIESRSELEITLVETLALMKIQVTETNSYIQEIRTTLGAVSSRMDRLETIIEGHSSEFEKILKKVDNSSFEIAAKVGNQSSEIEKIGQKIEKLDDRASEIAVKVKNQSSEMEKILKKVDNSSLEIAAKVENQSSEFSKIGQKVEDSASKIAAKVENQSSEFEKIGQKVEKVDNRASKIAAKVANQSSEMEKIGQKVEDSALVVAAKVSETQATIETVKTRQQAWISEIRLISLYKQTEENNKPFHGHDSDLVTDGQFTFDTYITGSKGMLTYSHTRTAGPDNKIWIELGGIFRIHKIKIWNMRHDCCRDWLVGACIYADKKLIGTVGSAKNTYDFTVLSDDPTYASRVTLHQPETQNIVILELQVWGSGPFQEDDKFA